MPDTQSINQNAPPDILPNFRNLGVALRSLLLVNVVGLLAVVSRATSWPDATGDLFSMWALLQPTLLLNLLLLYMLNPWLTRLSYLKGSLAVVLLVIASALVVYQFSGDRYGPAAGMDYFYWLRTSVIAGVMAAVLLAYFRLRAQVLSPALHVARLQALRARIRPHFLFNTINAVLGIVRADPKRAETALEDMADLFRMAMAHNSDQAPVHHEVELARQYLALEHLRLGDRLQVNWQIEALPEDALIPPLILQPLLENAVYHGIEPLMAGGAIDIKLSRNDKEIHIDVRNPRQPQSERHTGNKMALNNIRERLALQFDVEAQYTVETGKDFYHVHIMLPYVRKEKK